MIKFSVLGILFISLLNIQVKAVIRVVPTFNSAGIYWMPDGEISGEKAEIYFSETGQSKWHQGLDLHYLVCADGTFEFRGSLVRLKSGIEYKIRLFHNGMNDSLIFKTWNENFKIKKEIRLNTHMGTFETNEGGNATDGYVVYVPENESCSVIDGDGTMDVGINVRHNWVIIRGWKIRNVKNYGIRLHPTQKHVVIEKCEISRWGHNTGQRFAKAKESNAIHLLGNETRSASHIIIQDNYFLRPNCDTNNWGEASDITKAGNHPNGSQPIWLENTGGEIVIRYNTIKGDSEHYYNDGMGEWRNFGPYGFPNRDSDIHNNYISHVWDNAIECEGGNINVRIYENFTDSTYAHMGLSNITLGPIYIFNNVSNVGHKFPGDSKEAVFLKIGNKLKYDKTTNQSWPARGIAYVFNNTILQPLIHGKNNGIGKFATGTGPGEGVVYLNNIMHMSGNNGDNFGILPLQNNSLAKNNLYFGGVLDTLADTSNIYAKPVYDTHNDGWFLKIGSTGYAQGIFIPNFSEGDGGLLPDIGAYQTGKPELVFGVRKY